MRTIDEIIVHCTATKEGDNITAADIRRWHKAKGWADIGYHYVVRLDGTIEEGRPLAVAGAHCVGHNADTIGVVYVGGLDKNGKAADTRTKAQKRALLILINGLKKTFNIKKVAGHRDYANKACPCFDAAKEYGEND